MHGAILQVPFRTSGRSVVPAASAPNSLSLMPAPIISGYGAPILLPLNHLTSRGLGGAVNKRHGASVTKRPHSVISPNTPVRYLTLSGQSSTSIRKFGGHPTKQDILALYFTPRVCHSVISCSIKLSTCVAQTVATFSFFNSKGFYLIAICHRRVCSPG